MNYLGLQLNKVHNLLVNALMTLINISVIGIILNLKSIPSYIFINLISIVCILMIIFIGAQRKVLNLNALNFLIIGLFIPAVLGILLQIIFI